MDTEYAAPDDLAELRAIFRGRGNPPLGWPGVRAFEAEHGIVLPEPYRSFVAEIADGSPAGPPFGGLVPLAGLPIDMPEGCPDQNLMAPFPLAESWLWEAEEAEDPRSDEELELLLGPVLDHGSIVLGTHGCGMYMHLIVSGPQRGHIWLICDVGAAPFPFDQDSPAQPGFLGWVRNWAAGWDSANPNRSAIRS